MSACPYPGCTNAGQHRPYARQGLPSASTIAELIDDGKARSFAWSASLIAAVTAVHRSDDWDGLIGVMTDKAAGNGHTECTHTKDGLCKACAFLRSEFDRQWKVKANLGTHIHHEALAYAQGHDVTQDAVTEPYFDALERFYVDHNPEWVELERTVLYDKPRSHAYRGQFDGIGIIDCPTCPAVDGVPPRCRWLVDYKTGGFYPTSQTLQLSGYRYAQHLTVWEGRTETVTGPMPAVAHAGVLLLGDDGRFDLVDLPANGDAHATFLRLRDVWGWARQMEKWAKENPLRALDKEGIPS